MKKSESFPSPAYPVFWDRIVTLSPGAGKGAWGPSGTSTSTCSTASGLYSVTVSQPMSPTAASTTIPSTAPTPINIFFAMSAHPFLAPIILEAGPFGKGWIPCF